MRDATHSDGSHIVLKLIDADTHELAILKYLNEIKSAANHTIELHGVVDITVTKVIALKWRIPLDEYFRFHDAPESAASFPEQFLEGVAFLHEHRVAHMDLKPGNVVIDGLDRERPPRVVIIDFGLSIFIEDEDTVIEGFCGTPPWVAPEVGTRDGPHTEYSAILADRWSCGHMMSYIKKLLPGGGDDSRDGDREKLRDRLMSYDPRLRPSLKEVLDTYKGGGVKRIARAEESEMQKRARVSMYVCHSIASDC
jgi:serine/threonine protein kinase